MATTELRYAATVDPPAATLRPTPSITATIIALKQINIGNLRPQYASNFGQVSQDIFRMGYVSSLGSANQPGKVSTIVSPPIFNSTVRENSDSSLYSQIFHLKRHVWLNLMILRYYIRRYTW